MRRLALLDLHVHLERIHPFQDTCLTAQNAMKEVLGTFKIDVPSSGGG